MLLSRLCRVAAASTVRAAAGGRRVRIAVMGGDGIGPSVTEAAQMVVEAAGVRPEWVTTDIGWELWRSEGDPLPQRTLALLSPDRTDAALMGAITSKPAADAAKELKPHLQGKGLVYRSPIVRLRQELGLWANIRPCRTYEGHPSAMRGVDLVVVRENTEGLYAGVESRPVSDALVHALSSHCPAMKGFGSDRDVGEVALTARVTTSRASERIIRHAFELATRLGRPVTLVDKPNVLRATGGLMVEVGRKIAREFATVPFSETNVDAQCMMLVKSPQAFGVLVAENMFGDILSDLGAQLVGGLGFAPSANFGDKYAVFEPTHGSAPKYAGKGVANPVATILSARMMLEWLNLSDAAKRIEAAVCRVVKDGKVRTKDMGGSHSTMELARAIASAC